MPNNMVWFVIRLGHGTVGHRRHRRRLGGLTLPKHRFRKRKNAKTRFFGIPETMASRFVDLDIVKSVIRVTGFVLKV